MARRELKITYGSYVAGYGQAKRHPDGFVRVSNPTYDTTAVEFTIVIAGTTSASDFETEVDALRDEFVKPNQRLKVELVNAGTGAVEGTLADLKPTTTGRTALNIRPEVLAPDEEGISARSDVFRIRVVADLLASYDSDHVRQDVTYHVSFSPSRRRTLRIKGTFTATASAGALATYEAGVENLRSAIATTLGGTWPSVPVSEWKEPDKEDHLCPFDVVYRERIHNETIGTLDDSDVVDQQLRLNVDELGNDLGSTTDRPLLRVSASGFFALDQDQTTDLKGKWDAKILPWIKASLGTLAGTTVYITEANPGYDNEENALYPRVVGVALGGGTTLFRRVRTTDRIVYGPIFRSPWPSQNKARAESDDPDGAYVYFRSKTVLRTVEVVSRVVGNKTPEGSPDRDDPARGFLGGFHIGKALEFRQGKTASTSGLHRPSGSSRTQVAKAGGHGGGGRFLLERNASYTPRYLGLPSDGQLGVTDRTDVVVVRIVAAVPAAGGSGRGGRVITQTGRR